MSSLVPSSRSSSELERKLELEPESKLELDELEGGNMLKVKR